ncbi:chemotaxis protein CheB [Chitinophaga sp. sic0106]|uniref:chemotaxis protein CheB n=1 Tax=Chitinophaga sp. sic0106 TaxID=2854785 RepID=UPI002105ACD1|nr:chemotaxis protein CheB [Chitinophaga sp. sic0106]
MKPATGFDIIAIGGSAGSLPVMGKLVRELPPDMKTPVILVLHRLKNVYSELNKLMSTNRPIIEPEDKEPVKPGCIYLAPQNYHLLVEPDNTFSLDYSELVHYSRPAIDETFFSIAATYGRGALGILLSGANSDGAAGLLRIVKNGGTGIAQDPEEADFDIMPLAAIELSNKIDVMRTDEIATFIRTKYTNK